MQLFYSTPKRKTPTFRKHDKRRFGYHEKIERGGCDAVDRVIEKNFCKNRKTILVKWIKFFTFDAGNL